MNAAEHYKEAERLRDAARNAKDGSKDPWKWATYFHQAAMVHATLALVDGSASARQRQRIEALCENAEGIAVDWISVAHLRAALEES